jgi:hypothetical protein
VAGAGRAVGRGASSGVSGAFLPSVLVAAGDAVRDGGPRQDAARRLRLAAEAADRIAGECWTALVADCNAPVRRVLSSRLRELTEATSVYVGARSWFAGGSPHRGRVVDAEQAITDAVREGDGEDFAEAFVGYDQAVAMAVVSVQGRAGSRTR